MKTWEYLFAKLILFWRRKNNWPSKYVSIFFIQIQVNSINEIDSIEPIDLMIILPKPIPMMLFHISHIIRKVKCVLYIYMRTIVKGMLVVMHSVKYYFLTMQFMHHLLFIPRYHPKMKYMHRSRTKTSHYLNAFPPKHVDDISHKGNGICLNTRWAVIEYYAYCMYLYLCLYLN